eukprot:1982794-Lingulodinium_polyedra.AAC.1
MIGDALYPAIVRHQPTVAAKITGMLLELDNGDIMTILDSEHQLGSAVEAAMALLLTPGSAASAMTDQHLEGPSA